MNIANVFFTLTVIRFLLLGIMLKSSNKQQIQIAFEVNTDLVTYLDSIVDLTIVFCFLLDREIAHPT